MTETKEDAMETERLCPICGLQDDHDDHDPVTLGPIHRTEPVKGDEPEAKVLGRFRGEVVTFDGTTVRVVGEPDWCGITRDFDLNGTFRNWLARRDVVLP